MPGASRKIITTIIWAALYIAIASIITIYITRYFTRFSNSHISVLQLFNETAIITFAIGLLATPAGYRAIHLMRKKPFIIKLPVVIFVVLCATAAGNAIGRHIVQSWHSGTTNWLRFNDLTLNLLVAAGITIITIIIEDLTEKKNELLRDLNGTNDAIKHEFGNQSLSIREGDGYRVIKFSDLIYLSSHGKKVALHTTDGTYTASQLLKDIEKRIPSGLFTRVHKQFIINISYLKQIRYYEGGRYTAYLNDEDETTIPVGRNMAHSLRERFGI
jgi:hypothetical protein